MQLNVQQVQVMQALFKCHLMVNFLGYKQPNMLQFLENKNIDSTLTRLIGKQLVTDTRSISSDHRHVALYYIGMMYLTEDGIHWCDNNLDFDDTMQWLESNTQWI